MIRLRLVAFGLLMLGLGYMLGSGNTGPQLVTAQDADAGVSEDTANKIRAAQRALSEAMESLQAEGRYESITDGVNSFLILSGGGSAKDDLDSGRGVDPETFAALYAGRASAEVQELLDVDEQGRITYNNEVVRIYSKSRLQRIFANRIKILETE